MRYYTHDITAWMDGTESLTNGEYRVYHIVCELIYLHEGPIVLHEKGIAGRCNQHILEFRHNLASLVEKRKLELANGKISNRRATVELDRVHSSHPPYRPRTPGQPPTNPRATPDQPTRGLASKSLKRNDATFRAVGRLGLSSESKGFSDSKGVEGLFPSSEESPSLSNGVSESEISSLARWNFDAFWAQYPHKVGKRAAVKAFDAAKKRKASFEDLMLGLMRYAAKDDDRPWCNPATFLNQDRWLDEPAANGGKRRDETVDEQCARLVEQARELEAARRAERAGRTL